MLLGDGLELLLVAQQGRIAELAAQVFITGFDLVKTVKQAPLEKARSRSVHALANGSRDGEEKLHHVFDGSATVKGSRKQACYSRC